MFPGNINIYWVLAFVVLDLFFKGIALWRSVKHNQRNWFVVLLIINSAGILPILYLTIFDKKK